MTSEYNSKYLKEPPNQPGRHMSELMPPSHYTLVPLTMRRGTGGSRQSWQMTKRAPVEEKGCRGSLGTCALVPTPQKASHWLRRAVGPDHSCLPACQSLPFLCLSSSLFLSCSLSWTLKSSCCPRSYSSGVQILGASSFPTGRDAEPLGAMWLGRWPGSGQGCSTPFCSTHMSFADLLQKKSIGAKEETGFTEESPKNPIVFQPPSQTLPGDPVSQVGATSISG